MKQEEILENLEAIIAMLQNMEEEGSGNYQFERIADNCEFAKAIDGLFQVREALEKIL